MINTFPTLADRSGTITAANTSQVLSAAKPRKYLFIQNVSTADLWINFTAAAVAGQPSIRLRAGDSFAMEGAQCSFEAVNILGVASGQSFVGKEM